ncbi:glycosyltransferase family 2 protein [Pseudomonas sp. CFBP 13727]|jgi:glycosyltransferase involved in cell wall biosynthesis|uniref:glycosyltransferase family 2 protein n=2 Tax=unclassified Pseudomonas TaxID=196821 RepID=UPI000F06EFDF|nr:glycosyltransferase family 2 protein [Pseudomonas sp. CFBP 13727]MBD8601574.1 glycosyltransferase family 2 protein [Pseudomonas sp. CFBP 8771]MBD8621598.1 glycosyltransferase family 2 protein [Pseudomonas sp. CFBP 13727]
MQGSDTHMLESNKKPLVSISIPVLNESGNLANLYKRLVALGTKMESRCDLEFVFSDNHSDDATWDMLTELAATDPRVRAIRFSKNYGFQRSILANYMHTSGDAVMQIDADLQDPPELLEAFFERWQEGFDVVYGVRRKRPESWLLNNFRRVGYWAIDKVSEHPIPRDVGDFRLIDRKVVNVLLKTKTANPYLRGMIAGIGFNQTGIAYDRDARVAGESKFNVNRLVRLGLTAVFNHSTVPLRAASFVGSLILAASLIGALYYVILRLFHPELPPGLASIHILVLFGIGLNSFLLGIIGEYILRIYLVLRADPVAVIQQSLNFDPSDLKL